MTAAWAELVAATNYSFLRGASHPHAMVDRALALGLSGLGIADRNSVAGVVRAYVALRDARAQAPDNADVQAFRLIVGARLVFADDTPDIVAYPQNRNGWGRLTRLLTVGNRRAAKGDCRLSFDDLLAHADDLLLIWLGAAHDRMLALAEACPGRVWLGASNAYTGSDRRRLRALARLADSVGVPLLATCDALYATTDARPLHDVLTCIANGTTLAAAGTRLAVNAERHLKSPQEMQRLFAEWPDALVQSQRLLDRVHFSLDQLRYDYPSEPVPPGWTAQDWLEHLVTTEAHRRHPAGLPERWTAALAEEFALVRKCRYASYFLTVYDMVRFARSRTPPILCQGRGSAANSLICYLLGITSIDPIANNLLFTRFLSEERGEPPDIDVDFEHERREEVMQYVYARYGRERAAICAAVIHYRPRSALREVGKVLGLSEDVTARLSSTIWGSFGRSVDGKHISEAGYSLETPEIARLHWLVAQLLEFPRHLSQHVGGFVLTQGRLDELVPIHNAAMPDRTFIEWDKDDIDALGLMKVDVLALGMLTCIRKSFDLMRAHGLGDLALDTVPDEEAEVYDMLCRGDSIGVFQVESRAQINMLPRLRPRTFYDLVIEVAIVRPGPIEGEMVHPYLRRRSGLEPVEFPSPAPPHDPDELRHVLGRTFGVPLFQEQAMKLAIVAAGFTPDEANGLRRAMATFRNVGTMHRFRDKMIGGMVARGYDQDFAERCYRQIEGFGSYGFPESHAQSFARLVYVSSWLKCRHPAVFTCALLNSQPMGFYAPAQLVRDAQEHGVEVRSADINASGWDSSLESGTDGTLALRLGLRQITGFRREWAVALADARGAATFESVEALARSAGLPQPALRMLADADAMRSLGLDRRQALWEVRRTPADELPLFRAMQVRELAAEPEAALPPMPLSEHVVADYQTMRLSLKAHPMRFLRPLFDRRGVLSCAATIGSAAGARVRTAGVVLVRQRPGKGNAIFVTLEDETGVTNVVIWARLFERYRRAVMAARLMLVEGEIQRSREDVVHLMASSVQDLSADLARLSPEVEMLPQAIRSDEPGRDPPRGSHPRDVRILPRSRDFH